MMAARQQPGLLERLPAVAGRLRADVSLAPLSWFRTGGAAEVLFEPADEADLAAFLAACPADVPLSVIGAGSNLLVRDGGIPGVTIRPGRAFATIRAGDGRLRAGAMALDITVAMRARDAGLAGLEFLRGIPGSIGGALRMNAGAYGSEIADVLLEAEALDRGGRRHRIDAAGLGFGYRHCSAPEDWIFTAAVLSGVPDRIEEIAARLADIDRARRTSQPVGTRTGGSTFRNPEGAKAWELIDRAGCRGLRRGGAVVSEQHCNFLINEGGASAADIEGLGEDVRRRVFEQCGVSLHWEIRRIGRHAGPAAGGGA